MLSNKKVLIVAPHPDDEAISSGGLIMLCKKHSSKVLVLYISVGFSRQFVTGSTTEKERMLEIAKASKFGNFEYKIAFQGESFTKLDTLPQKDLIEIIEDASHEFKPDIVCIPFRNSFNQDHRAVSLASITAFRPLPRDLRHQPKIVLESEEPYSWTTGEIFKPNFYFDISNCIEDKLDLLRCHKTQLRDDPFSRSPDNLRRLAGSRGCEISVKYAEGYNLLRGQLL